MWSPTCTGNGAASCRSLGGRSARPDRRAGTQPGLTGPDDQQTAHVDTAGIQCLERCYGQFFAVARPLLEGRIAAAAGDLPAAIERFQAAVTAEDQLAYDEPPSWYYPVRETLGAALLASGKAVEAEQIFRADLKYNPRNGRSLFGVWQSLQAQGKKAAAARARLEFQRVWTVADVTLRLGDL